MAEGRRKKRFGDFDAAIEMREVIAELVKTELQKQRPRYRYATVDSVTPAAFKAYVTFNGEDVSVLVNTGAFNFVQAGDIVRIEGIGVDKYIAGVVNRGTPTASGTTTFNISGGQSIGDVVYSAAASKANALRADGSAVSRTAYAALFAVIGTSFGAGDGSTTFNLPNLKGRAVVGHNASDSDFNALGITGGSKTVTLTLDQTPTPILNTGDGDRGVVNISFSTTTTGRTQQDYHISVGGLGVLSHGNRFTGASTLPALGASADQGRDQVRFRSASNDDPTTLPHENMSPYIVMYPYIIATLTAVVAADIAIPRLRLTATDDVSPTSTQHALQIGPTSGANLTIDNNEILARNNGAVSGLYLGAENDGGLAIEPGVVTIRTASRFDVRPVDLPGGVNLNTYTESGLFFQDTNTDAVSGSNYPVPLAGILEVVKGRSDTSFVTQWYTVYGTYRRVYMRSLYNGTWSNWILQSGPAESAALAMTGSHVGAYSPTCYRRGNDGWLDGAISASTLPAGVSTYTAVATIPDGWRPNKYQYYPVTLGGTAVLGSLRIYTTGVMEVSISATSTAVLPLTGVRFALDV